MFSDLVVITGITEISALAVDNLERDTTGSGSDDGDTGVDGLRNLDLKAFTSGELKSNVGVIQEGVQDCIDTGIRTTS